MVGEVDDASQIMAKYSTLIRRYGMPPEFYHLKDEEPVGFQNLKSLIFFLQVSGRAAYPLRPEFAESLMYLYRATDDPYWLEQAAQMVDVCFYIYPNS